MKLVIAARESYLAAQIPAKPPISDMAHEPSNKNALAANMFFGKPRFATNDKMVMLIKPTNTPRVIPPNDNATSNSKEPIGGIKISTMFP